MPPWRHGLGIASLFVHGLQQHFFGRESFVSIVLPPNERKILLHLMPPAVVDPSTSTTLGALEPGANDRSAGLFDCPSNSGDEFGQFGDIRARCFASLMPAKVI
jgi:hypothetical protein